MLHLKEGLQVQPAPFLGIESFGGNQLLSNFSFATPHTALSEQSVCPRSPKIFLHNVLKNEAETMNIYAFRASSTNCILLIIDCSAICISLLSPQFKE